MDNIIENIYLKNNLPGFENLYKLVKAAGHSEIKKKDINLFLENQKEYELLKIKTKKKKKRVILQPLIIKILHKWIYMIYQNMQDQIRIINIYWL